MPDSQRSSVNRPTEEVHYHMTTAPRSSPCPASDVLVEAKLELSVVHYALQVGDVRDAVDRLAGCVGDLIGEVARLRTGLEGDDA